jgi:hypothetical protein
MATAAQVSANTVRRQIEAALEQRIPAALTPAAKVRNAVQATGIRALDGLLSGGLPEGAVSELVGPECSGRTAVALAFVARMTREGKVCAWVDVTDSLDPVSAAAAGVDLRRMLWVRCGVSGEVASRQTRFEFKVPEQYFVPPVVKKGLHGGGFGAHPRDEVRGMAGAVGALDGGALMVKAEKSRSPAGMTERKATATADAKAGSSLTLGMTERKARATATAAAAAAAAAAVRATANRSSRPWGRMEQAMRAADLLLQAGGFGAVVIDMGGLPPEFVSRVPLATWFRYRAAAERTRASVVLLTQVACAKSSAEVVLRMEAEEILAEPTVFAGLRPSVEVVRQRFGAEPSNVVSIRKGPYRETGRRWESRTICG